MASSKAAAQVKRPRNEWNAVTVLHTGTAAAAIGLGAMILMKRKGTLQHKRWGRMWVGSMLTASLTSSAIRTRPDGHLSWIHGLSTFTIACVGLGVVAARQRHWASHKRNMIGSLFGATVAGAFAIASPDRLLYDLLVRQNQPAFKWA